MKRNDEIRLGDTVRDAITGFTGVATSRVEYMNGCVQYAVQPRVDKDGKVPDAIYIDWQRVEFLESGTFTGVAEVVAMSPGGPQRDTPSSSYRG